MCFPLLAQGNFDLIHFNYGMHDLANYGGNLTPLPLPIYGQNLIEVRCALVAFPFIAGTSGCAVLSDCCCPCLPVFGFRFVLRYARDIFECSCVAQIYKRLSTKGTLIMWTTITPAPNVTTAFNRTYDKVVEYNAQAKQSLEQVTGGQVCTSAVLEPHVL